MKATLFVASEKEEIRLSNGIQFFKAETETSKEFVKRVEAIVDRDYVDILDVNTVSATTLVKKGTTELAKALEVAKDVEAKLLEEILYARKDKQEATKKVATIKSEDKLTKTQQMLVDAAEKKFKATKMQQMLVDATACKEWVATAKQAAIAVEKKFKATRKGAKTKTTASKAKVKKEVIKVTLEEAKKTQVLAKEFVKKTIQFMPFRGTELLKGVVKSTSINKRINKVYLNVMVGEKLTCCAYSNATIKVVAAAKPVTSK